MVIYGYGYLWLFMVYFWLLWSELMRYFNSQQSTGKKAIAIYIYILASIMRGTGVSNRTHDDCWSIQQGGLIKQHLENLQSFLTFWRPRNFRLRMYAQKRWTCHSLHGWRGYEGATCPARQSQFSWFCDPSLGAMGASPPWFLVPTPSRVPGSSSRAQDGRTRVQPVDTGSPNSLYIQARPRISHSWPG